jgi:hypothetical protein
MTLPLLLLALAAAPPETAALEAARAETDPAKRAAKAMDCAAAQLAEARSVTSTGGAEAVIAALARMIEGVELAFETVRGVRKPASIAKRVEIRCRDLLRRLETLIQDLPVDEREGAKPSQDRLRAVQDQLLEISMGRS